MSTNFRDPEFAERARARLEALGGIDLGVLFEEGFDRNPAPDLAVTNLERWLRATSSAQVYLELVSRPTGTVKTLLNLLGASQPLADTLIQNPELAYLVLDPGALKESFDSKIVENEGRKLLEASTSYTHSLDRLRFLRQKWNLLLVVKDLSDAWPQEQIWQAISDLAEVLIRLTLDVVWKDRGFGGPCPLMVIAFGKLAGGELNYSSDIDLAYVSPDDYDGDLTRFCEAFSRALSDRMGRGALYRVDLRLRPYGSAGAVVQKMRSMEAYYRLYAEPWEVQALVRTKPIIGPKHMVDAWNEMRAKTCFRPKMIEADLEQLVLMRDKIEAHSSGDDLKRGSGGIRDVEFLTQIMQILHGFAYVELQTPKTLVALKALDDEGLLEHADASSLAEGYRFLRKLEHRTQLVGDQQTHHIPNDPDARDLLARLMGMGDWAELSLELTAHRRTILSLYRSILNLDLRSVSARTTVQDQLGPVGSAALQWIDVLPESEAYYRSLVEDLASLERLKEILLAAPSLVPYFKKYLGLSELLFSGEILDSSGGAERITSLPMDVSPKVLADTYTQGYAVIFAKWILGGESDLPDISSLLDALIIHLCQRLQATFDVIALGSQGTGDAGPESDADLLLLVDRKEMHRDAEIQAQNLLKLVAELRRHGAPIHLDLRLRPDGGKGFLVRTYEGFSAYDFDGMEMWERAALGNGRLLMGNQEALRVVQKSATGLPLTPERLKELSRMKRRIETERVKPQHVRRNIKLGSGGLHDIEWIVHLHEMRYPTALKVGTTTNILERLRSLGRAGLLNVLEVELLCAAFTDLQRLRIHISLLGISDDLVPENPDRLDRLGKIMGFADGNEFLASHEKMIDSVRRLYTETLARLNS